MKKPITDQLVTLHFSRRLAYRTAQRTSGSSGRRARHADHRLRAGLDRAAGRQRARDRGAAAGDRRLRRAEEGATLIARFTEVESGRNPDRPELGKALHLAKVTGATLVIAKLDRLSRNAAFLLTLRDSGVRFAAGGPAGGERPHRRHHGAGGAAGARGDLQAHQGGAGRGQEPRGAARQPQRRGGAQAGWQGRCAAPGGHCAATPTGTPGTSRRWWRTSARAARPAFGRSRRS